VNARSDLAGLVRIWEHWTDMDPSLRRAVYCTADNPSVGHTLQDQAFARIQRLQEGGDLSQATAAAVYAGTAVYMALLGADTLFKKTWQQMCHDAQVAHERALAAARRNRRRQPLLRQADDA
jgi:hypothetical protein